eukprot:GEZU01017922.1.p1 GENE.GEZU01017922.1~~GEZU01017922.1.p1  ORF type:complete len:127 (+),score=38.27 GEZU01017922.1:57-437(+)
MSANQDNQLQQQQKQQYTKESIHSNNITDVYDVPMSVIKRPIPSILDEEKVQSLMQSIQNEEDVTPIDIMWIKGEEGGNYYYAFGGCHRWEAHKRLGRTTIKGKLIETTPQTLQTYLGASAPKHFK